MEWKISEIRVGKVAETLKDEKMTLLVPLRRMETNV